ncbi:MAG: S8 family serine peptidase [Actinobacteria bacterium]|nr:S8 family serine peptidase [Actinomycetota bacterium]
MPATAAAQENGLRAHAAYVPNDSGVAAAAADSGWTNVQWELNGPFGINAPQAWSQASRLGGSGGRGVTIAVIDSGVAYADRGRYRRSPDLSRARFVRGYDFVDGDPYPNDEYGHGTFIASAIAATANNAYGTVGVAYRSRIMPLRVLDAEGRGYPSAIARAIRHAIRRGADVINLSLELYDGPLLTPTPRSVTGSKSVRAALSEARRAGVVVVAAAGNSSDPRVPAKRHDTLAINVGGTTERGCLGDYSNHGPGLDVVAPGGGGDAEVPDDANCQPVTPPGRDISAVSFRPQSPWRFEIVPRFRGTSTAAPLVAGVAALVLASKVLGANPSPREVEAHLERTARDLGRPGRDRWYGAGLVDATAATQPVTPSG